MTLRTALAGSAIALVATGLVTFPAPASAEHAKVRTGSCSMEASYRMRLVDAHDHPERLRTRFVVDSDKADRKWTVRVFRSGELVFKHTKRTGDEGNVAFARTFRGHSDHHVRVVARSGYGEKCVRRMHLGD